MPSLRMTPLLLLISAQAKCLACYKVLSYDVNDCGAPSVDG